MKNKVLVGILVAILAFTMISVISVSAMEYEDFGLEAKFLTPKKNYADDEEIDLRLQLKNVSGGVLKDIKANITLPEGLELKSGDLSFEKDILPADEVLTISLVAQKGSKAWVWMALLILLVCGAAGAALFVLMKRKKAKGAFVLLAGILLLIGATVVPVAAESECVQVNKILTVDGQKVEINAEITYERTITNVAGFSQYPTRWIYQMENGIMVREATFDSGKGGKPVEIMHLSDLHFNYLNDLDMEEANPTLLSTYEYRKWGANGEFAEKARPVLEYASKADQMIITGDILDYLSHGCVELMQKEILDKYPNTLMTVGNHEFPQMMQGKEPESLSKEDRWAWVEDVWSNDIYYCSKVIEDKVMTILLGNGERSFYQQQIEPLSKDLAEAREKGYVVLLFMHEPIATMNKSDAKTFPIRRNDADIINFYQDDVVSPDRNDATKSVYELIVNNADVVKGIFNGHMHSDYYTEVQAKTASGESMVIPQYTLTGSIYDDGHLLKITVK